MACFDRIDKIPVRGIVCVIGCMLLHLCYGYFYTIGNMGTYIIAYLAEKNQTVSGNHIVILTSVMISTESISMPLGGALLKWINVRLIVALGCVLQCAGIALTYFTLNTGIVGIIITYGAIQGFGFGFCYSVLVQLAITWFPKRRGLVAGLVLGSFAAGGFVFTPIQTSYINPDNIQVDNTTNTFSDPQLLQRVPYAFLILAAVVGSMEIVGVAMITAAPVVPLFYGLEHIPDDRFLAQVAMAGSVCNAGGRILWGQLVDWISFKIPLTIALCAWALLMLSFPHLAVFSGSSLPALYAVWVCLMFLCVSSVYVIVPTAMHLLFGTKQLALTFGLLYSANLFGSITSALLANFAFQSIGLIDTFTVSGFICAAAMCTVILTRDPGLPSRLQPFDLVVRIRSHLPHPCSQCRKPLSTIN